MPGPFPGMNPYLEGPSYWRGVHAGLITLINQELNATLPLGFGANIDEREYVVAPSILTVLADEIRESYIEIRAATPDREIVTIIEVLRVCSQMIL